MNQFNQSTQSNQVIDSFEMSDEAKLNQQQLRKIIRENIASSGGAISFSSYMNAALYQPKLGYYQNQLQKFGEQGDFITAPEMGKYFATCLAASLASALSNLITDSSADLLEIGAGSGVLAFDLMLALDQLNSVPENYFILEPSSSLQQQQTSQLQKLPEKLKSRIRWISELPDHFTGVILANEVLDAIPFKRIQREKDEWLELGVAVNDEGFQATTMELADINDLPKQLCQSESEQEFVFSDGYITEIRPLIGGWIKSLANALDVGAIMLIDYGYSADEYYHPQRAAGTLSCFVRHHQHDDPFQFEGLQDITAHVDFSQVARAAEENNLNIDGYTTQAGFLLENGITQLAEKNARHQSDQQRFQSSRELQQLLMPGQMGEVIKVILLSKAMNNEIPGFSMQDHLHRL
ncbi:MAG: SAM-dependent methyltransferase [Kangiellaceae bacterium]|nr:SAM-dependent methyltransferase [Kangiellaceae bacterium]